jgi:glutathione S-transferase
MIKLYGSTTSPYVRRLRIFFASVEHEFVNMQIFEPEDREFLIKHNPTLKIPMIEDNGQVIFDSRVVFRYLTDKLNYPTLTWEQENQLTIVDAANDSLVQMFLIKNSKIDTGQDKMYFSLQRERLDTTFSELSRMVQDGGFDHWNYPAICLYCLLDWVVFREFHDLSQFPDLLEFHDCHKDHIEVTATNPRG